jgi:amidase/aspartyl-tRNA(Asn)/glutamyl-tRNA(Gln) amidotransferase subunit A
MMRLSDELAYVTAAELAMRIRRRELSPVEVVEAFIERIEERNKSLNAFVSFEFEDARKKAQEAERTLMSGGEIGVLHGVPTATKDMFDSRPGSPMTLGGIRGFKNFKAKEYGLFAKRMEKAGAIILGGTNSPVFGFRGTTDNYLFGPTRNPFNTSKNSGGSSGGSAAAVADGLIPIAEGSDGGGSIRIPAAWCNLYGYKASAGRIPMPIRPNAFLAGAVFATLGTMARTVEDAILGLNVLSGYDARDPLSLDEDIDFTGALHRSINGWKIAYSPDFDVFPVDDSVSAVVAEAVKIFRQAGASVEEVKLGIKHDQKESGDKLGDMWCRIMATFLIGFLDAFKQQGIDLLKDYREDLPPQLIEWCEKGYTISALDIFRDQQARTEIYDAIQNVLENHDLLITPTLACPPVDNSDDGDTMGPTQIKGVEINPLIGWCLTHFTNYSGHPSASIPAGLTQDKLPVGMHIIGRRYADLDVLSASAAFERIKPWYDIYKICETRSSGSKLVY